MNTTTLFRFDPPCSVTLVQSRFSYLPRLARQLRRCSVVYLLFALVWITSSGPRLQADDCFGAQVKIVVRNAGTVDWGGCSVGNPHYTSDAGGGVWSDAGLGFLAVGQQALFTGSQSPNTTLNYSISLP